MLEWQCPLGHQGNGIRTGLPADTQLHRKMLEVRSSLISNYY